MTMTRDFKGIWIPKEIRISKDITLQEKVMLVEIQSLSFEIGCFATNSYFAEFFDLSEDRISKIISSLHKKGYINIDIDRDNGNKRVMTPLSVKTLIPYHGKHLYPISENADPYIMYNNIIYNNISQLTEKLTEDDKEKYKNEIYILSIMFKMGYTIKNGDAFEQFKWLKNMIARYIPYKDDGRFDWKKAIAETDDWSIYWSNPPKGKKPPTNIQMSLINWMKPKERKK